MLGEDPFERLGGVAWLSLEEVLASSLASCGMASVFLPLSGSLLVVGGAAGVGLVKKKRDAFRMRNKKETHHCQQGLAAVVGRD